MKILHVASEYPPQEVFGLGRYVSELSRELVLQGHDVHVLTNSMGEGVQDFMNDGVAVHRVDYPPPPKPPGNLAPALAFNVHLLQRALSLGMEGLGHPDVIVSHDWLTSVAAHRMAQLWRCPHVWTVHDTHRGKLFNVLQHPTDQMTVALERWSATHADMVLVNSSSVAAEVIAEGGDPKRIRIVPCGIDPDRYTSQLSPARRAAFRLSLCAPDHLLITYAGRLDLEKGIDTLINSLSGLRVRHPHVSLVMAGKGVLQETIQAHVRELDLEDCVSLIGYLQGDVLRAFYAASDIHVCPSSYEPFGLVAVEAMAAGVPVIVSNVGGLADIVATEAIGLRVAPKDVSGWMTALDRLCADAPLRQSLGRAGQAHVRAQYAWTSIAMRAVAAYAEADADLAGSQDLVDLLAQTVAS